MHRHANMHLFMKKDNILDLSFLYSGPQLFQTREPLPNVLFVRNDLACKKIVVDGKKNIVVDGKKNICVSCSLQRLWS
jgi:hypothetical protein